MRTLLEIANEKLKLLRVYQRSDQAILPQLMLRVFNEETPDDLNLNMYDRNDMEQEVIALLEYSDKQVMIMLHLTDPEREQEIATLLIKTETTDQIREVMIMEVLFEAMMENLDDFPYHRRVGGIA